MMQKIYKNIKEGYEINKKEAIELLNYETYDLTNFANKVRKHFLKDAFDICSIVNGKSGKCSENCKFCAQSSIHKTNINVYTLLKKEEFIKDAIYHKNKGVKKYLIVTSGKNLNEKEIEKLYEIYKFIGNDVGIEIYGSHGLLDEEDLKN